MAKGIVGDQEYEGAIVAYLELSIDQGYPGVEQNKAPGCRKSHEEKMNKTVMFIPFCCRQTALRGQASVS